MKKIMFLLVIIMAFAFNANVDAKRGRPKGSTGTHVSKGTGHHNSGKAHKARVAKVKA